MRHSTDVEEPEGSVRHWKSAGDGADWNMRGRMCSPSKGEPVGESPTGTGETSASSVESSPVLPSQRGAGAKRSPPGSPAGCDEKMIYPLIKRVCGEASRGPPSSFHRAWPWKHHPAPVRPPSGSTFQALLDCHCYLDRYLLQPWPTLTAA